MSRLDWFTIAVVGICIAAIVFLLIKTSSLLNNENSIMADPNTELLDDADSDLSEDDIYTDETIDPDNDENDDSFASEDDIDSGELTDATATAAEDDGMNTGKGGSDDYEEEEEEPEEEAPSRINTSPSSGDSGGNYMVVAGSFAQMLNAENFVKSLQKKGYAGAEVGKFNAGKYATALAGRFDSQSEAQALVADLKANGIEAYIQKRK